LSSAGWLTNPPSLISTFSRYGDMKCVKNAQMGMVWGGYGSPKVIGNATIR